MKLIQNETQQCDKAIILLGSEVSYIIDLVVSGKHLENRDIDVSDVKICVVVTGHARFGIRASRTENCFSDFDSKLWNHIDEIQEHEILNNLACGAKDMLTCLT